MQYFKGVNFHIFLRTTTDTSPFFFQLLVLLYNTPQKESLKLNILHLAVSKLLNNC